LGSTIKLPARALVVLCGPAACGKTTFAAKHFAATQVVSSDACRSLVSDDPGNHACSADAFAVLYAIVRARLKFDRLTVVDSTALSADSRKRLLKIAGEFDAPAVLIFFRVPLAVCLERNRRRPRRVPAAVIERQCEQANEAAARIGHERFARVYELDAVEIDTAQVQIGAADTRRCPGARK